MKLQIEIPPDLLKNIVREVLAEAYRQEIKQIANGRTDATEVLEEIKTERPDIVEAVESLPPAESKTEAPPEQATDEAAITSDDLRALARDKLNTAKTAGNLKAMQDTLTGIWKQFGPGSFSKVTDIAGAYNAVKAL